MPGFECLIESFVVASESSKSTEPGEGSFDDPPSGEKDESSLRLGMLDDLQSDPLFLGGLSGVLTSVALVDEGDLHALLADLLDFASQRRDLRSFLLVGRGGDQRQQIPQRVDRGMDFGAVLLLVTVEAGATAAFGRRLQRPAVHDHRRRPRAAIHCQANQLPQVMRGRFERPSVVPATRLLIDGRPRRKIMR
mgnify:CR=1 FL=1